MKNYFKVEFDKCNKDVMLSLATSGTAEKYSCMPSKIAQEQFLGFFLPICKLTPKHLKPIMSERVETDPGGISTENY